MASVGSTGVGAVAIAATVGVGVTALGAGVLKGGAVTSSGSDRASSVADGGITGGAAGGAGVGPMGDGAGAEATAMSGDGHMKCFRYIYALGWLSGCRPLSLRSASRIMCPPNARTMDS